MTVQIMFGDTTYKYGNTNRVYGVPGTTPTTLLWSIEVDWDGDGVFNGDNESKYCFDMSTDRGFDSGYNTSGDGDAEFPPPLLVGTCSLSFRNATGRFSAWSVAAGSLGNKVTPGKKVRIKVRNGYSGSDRPIFAGLVKDI